MLAHREVLEGDAIRGDLDARRARPLAIDHHRRTIASTDHERGHADHDRLAIGPAIDQDQVARHRGIDRPLDGGVLRRDSAYRADGSADGIDPYREADGGTEKRAEQEHRASADGPEDWHAANLMPARGFRQGGSQPIFPW